MVNSSFEYFPALPIHKSKDLVNWELVGYGLNRIEQVSGQISTGYADFDRVEYKSVKK
jgi:xylan 1,4-beta-xylosidase